MTFTRAFAKAHKIAAEHRARLLARAPHVDTAIFAAKKDSRGELYLYGVIGDSFWGDGITDAQVVEALAKLKGVSQLDVRINSEGGNVFQAKGIYNALRRFEAKKTVYVDGLAASAASFIAMAGDRIVTAENATWMIHEAHGGAMGCAADMRALADVLDQENKAIAGIYAARTGRPASSYWTRVAPSAAEPSPNATGLMADDTWMNAEEALALKLCDEIEKNAASDDGEANDSLAAKIPALRIAADTQRRISMARARLVDADHSVLQDRRRASPTTNSLRPAARPPHA